jgi:hypothetical protein
MRNLLEQKKGNNYQLSTIMPFMVLPYKITLHGATLKVTLHGATLQIYPRNLDQHPRTRIQHTMHTPVLEQTDRENTVLVWTNSTDMSTEQVLALTSNTNTTISTDRQYK